MFSFLQKNKDIQVIAPVSGYVKKIEEVDDPVFSEKMMGDGIAIQYTDGDVYAPMAGEITTVILPSCHAFGMKTTEGLELLVHVGLETVNLKGEGFKLLKQPNEQVEAGEKILEIDSQLLKEKGINMITPIIVTNSDTFKIVKQADAGSQVAAGKSELLVCAKK